MIFVEINYYYKIVFSGISNSSSRLTNNIDRRAEKLWLHTPCHGLNNHEMEPHMFCQEYLTFSIGNLVFLSSVIILHYVKSRAYDEIMVL